MSPCPVCGNDIILTDVACKFCGAPLETASADPAPDIPHRIVNIERGRPLVDTALKQMENELARARTDRVRVVTLIHGYGSSGKGGTLTLNVNATGQDTEGLKNYVRVALLDAAGSGPPNGDAPRQPDSGAGDLSRERGCLSRAML